MIQQHTTRDYTFMRSDTIYATLTCHGKVLAHVQGSGCMSRSDVLEWLKSKATNCRGIVTMFIRNITRQWSFEESYYLKPVKRAELDGGCMMFGIS